MDRCRLRHIWVVASSISTILGMTGISLRGNLGGRPRRLRVLLGSLDVSLRMSMHEQSVL